MNRSTSQKNLAATRAASWLTILIFLLTLGSIWYPEFARYHVPSETITPSMIEEARRQPANAVFEEIQAHRMLPREWQSDAQLISSAEKLLKGKAEVPGHDSIDIHLPFDASDLERGSGLWQLQFAGLIVPEILIDAYRLTGREEFYVTAREIILAWASYERGALLEHGFLWNDHAVAARVRTLSDFWSILRRRPDYRADDAQAVWGFAARTGGFLAKPDQYTFSTNHGVMQNLALWQLCLAFPTLSRAKQYKQLAFTRLKDEMAFYVSPDGVVLEHSADYHEFGLHLFGIALRYATLLGFEIPPEWERKYEQAKKFYAEIRRPDGSLPLFGDVYERKNPKGIPVTRMDLRGSIDPLGNVKDWRPPDSFGFFPVAGYAVLWDGLPSWPTVGNLSQAVLAWSYYPGHGHKHADELSILLWAGGHDWLTNAGYWPYEDADRSHAECWEGSNAPHLLGETCGPNRTSTLSSFLRTTGGLFAAEMERRGPNDLLFRRLAIHPAPSTWILVDECSGASQKTMQTIWTTAAEVALERGTASGEYRLSAGGAHLRAYFFGTPEMKIRSLRGSRDPFAGWVVSGGRPQATSAVVTEQPSEGAWALTVWEMDGAESRAERSHDAPRVLKWESARNWRILIPLGTGAQEISRQGEKISLEPGAGTLQTREEAVLTPLAAEVSNQIAIVHASFLEAAKRYPRFRDLFRFRLRASGLLLGLFAFQEVFVVVYGRTGGKHLATLRSLALLGWLVLCSWVLFSYLRAS
jgi:hypothetical protein